MNRWYGSDNENSDVVLFSKIRLSRNLSEIPFSSKLSNDQLKSVNKRVFACIKNSHLAGEFDMINIDELSKAKAHSYAEHKLISDEFAQKSNAAFLVNKAEDVSIVLNDDEHIKINAFASSDNIEDAYATADEIDDILIKGLKIAYSEKLGFLTASPMSLGTGMNAEIVLHLPALAQSGSITRLSAMVARIGFSLKEVFDNGIGNAYILSNQVTLGISEKNAIANLKAVCGQIVNQERKLRNALNNDADFEDKIYRTLGILKLARKLNIQEFLNNLSLVRLGISLGYFDYSYSQIDDMIYNLFDASLVCTSNSDLSQSMCETLRADIVREKLG